MCQEMSVKVGILREETVEQRVFMAPVTWHSHLLLQ